MKILVTGGAGFIGSHKCDRLVSRGHEAGATGARVAGAGGGGFVLVVCPVEHQAGVRAALPEMKEFPIKIDPYGSRVVLDVHRNIWADARVWAPSDRRSRRPAVGTASSTVVGPSPYPWDLMVAASSLITAEATT